MSTAFIGLDLAKSVFQGHSVDAQGKVVVTKRLRRDAVLAFFASLPVCVVGMEACAGSHFWAREIARLGGSVNFRGELRSRQASAYHKLYHAAEIRSRSAATRWTWMTRRRASETV